MASKLEQDIETACDEKVLKALGYEERKLYATAIFHCAQGKRRQSGIFASFGGYPVAERVKHVLKTSEKSLATPVVCVALCLFLLTGCMSNSASAITGKISGADKNSRLVTNFIAMKIPDLAEYTFTDYAISGDVIYGVLSHKTNEGVYRLVSMTADGNVKSEESLLAGENRTLGSIYADGSSLYYFSKGGSDIPLRHVNVEENLQKVVYFMEDKASTLGDAKRPKVICGDKE